MHRTIAGAALALLLAGCTAGGGQTGSEGTPSPEPVRTAESSATPSRTPSELPDQAAGDEPISQAMIEAARGLNATTYEALAAAYKVLHEAAQRHCYPVLDATGDLSYSADMEAEFAEEFTRIAQSTGPVSAKDKLELGYATSVAVFCGPST
ncbi:hypothetical protein [Agromyces indicus]|uniref:Lipoprotein n=1 Tax=Agromyces indicus TaxID=758919 RepID=A0ABU1FJF1_9MICO|nr:hypothetical protein [Agromyces indicus]MDR5691888.1 hypothetical protein [Agromyces indicus]